MGEPHAPAGVRRHSQLARLGLTNVCLKAGVLLLLFGVACGGVLFLAGPHASTLQPRLAWGMTGGVISGLVVYVIGRIAQVLRARSG
ncbi:hypothetical protein ACF3M1_15700 [Luteimonas sp. WGS1318]|uniref:hypothetical protein n=1 Tax=Luteimonas sp. WGS1318 TaxID=3366815 RepID=UPI00372CFD0F